MAFGMGHGFSQVYSAGIRLLSGLVAHCLSINPALGDLIPLSSGCGRSAKNTDSVIIVPAAIKAAAGDDHGARREFASRRDEAVDAGFPVARERRYRRVGRHRKAAAPRIVLLQWQDGSSSCPPDGPDARRGVTGAAISRSGCRKAVYMTFRARSSLVQMAALRGGRCSVRSTR